MIKIYRDDNHPSGEFWIDYDHEEDGPVVEHLLNGGPWIPHEDYVRDFIRVAALHGLKLEMP